MDMTQVTKISLVWELYCEGVPKAHIADKLGIGRATVHRWIDGIKQYGELNFFLDAYQQAKKGERAKRKVDPIVKRWVWELREEHNNCCGQKIAYHLNREHNLSLGTKTIYKILGEKYQLRSRWKKNQKRGAVPQASHPREVIQMDTVDFGEVFAFTSIDIYSKEPAVVLRPSLTSHDGVVFLETVMEETYDSHSDLLQADGGSEFKDEFRKKVYAYTDRFRVARPYKKNEQSFIENFNGSLRREYLGWARYTQSQIPSLQQEVNRYLVYWYETRPHLALNMQTPKEFKLSHI